MIYALTTGEDRKLNSCKYCGCFVCKDPSQINILERIFQRRKLDCYICPKAKYVCLDERHYIIYDNLDSFLQDHRGVYVNLITGGRLYINWSNFLIMCPREDSCINPEAYVRIYNSSHNGDSKE